MDRTRLMHESRQMDVYKYVIKQDEQRTLVSLECSAKGREYCR